MRRRRRSWSPQRRKRQPLVRDSPGATVMVTPYRKRRTSRRRQSMFGQVIRALIYLCFMVLAFYLIIYVLEVLGIRIPPMVQNILMLILLLFAILILYQLFSPYIGGVNWWG